MLEANKDYGHNQQYDWDRPYNFLGDWRLNATPVKRTYTGEQAIPTPERQRTANKEGFSTSFDIISFFKNFRFNN